jgi:hypothetical protein
VTQTAFADISIITKLALINNPATGTVVSRVMVPTDARDVTVFWNDVGAGFWLYQAAMPQTLIQAMIPTLKVHVNTPQDYRGAFDTPIGFPDVVNLTSGFYVLLPRGVLGVAAGTPLSWPRPYSTEFIATYSLRF